MSLSDKSKEILTVAMADAPYATEVADAVDANTSSNTTNATAIALNTAHRTSDGKNHSDVVLNNAHRVSDGKNHADVVLNNAHRTSAGTDHSDVGLANTHRTSAGTDHSDVVLNNSARNTNYKIANIMIATTNDVSTDATTLGVVANDFIVEVDVAGGGVIGSGVIVAPNTFVGAVTIGSVLMHFKPIV